MILEIEIQGALKIREAFPEALLLFVTPPSAEVLRDRLIGRGTETREVIDRRLQRAGEESEGMTCYDYLIINDDLETCIKDMHNVILAEKKKISRNQDLVSRIQKELKEL